MNVEQYKKCIYAPPITVLQMKKNAETCHNGQHAPQESISELFSGHCASV